MALPTFTIRQLLEAGVHFGHKTARWNPKMEPYIFGHRNKIHILNLDVTVPLLKDALMVANDVASVGGKILFVGTKRQAQKLIKDAAEKCGQHYVNYRWLGGMLTNWKTVSKSIKTLKNLEKEIEKGSAGYTKKELLNRNRSLEKLTNALGGIKDMNGTPDLMIVFDTIKDDIAIQEANKLNIPVVAIVDSNSNPDNISYPVPGNDDAIRSLSLYSDLFAASIVDGLSKLAGENNIDLGEHLNPEETVIDDNVVENIVSDSVVDKSVEIQENNPIADKSSNVSVSENEDSKDETIISDEKTAEKTVEEENKTDIK